MRKLKAFTLTEIVVAILVITVVLTATLAITKNKMEKVDKYYYYMAYTVARDISQNVLGQKNFDLIMQQADSGVSKLAWNINNLFLSKLRLKGIYATTEFTCPEGYLKKMALNDVGFVCENPGSNQSVDFSQSVVKEAGEVNFGDGTILTPTLPPSQEDPDESGTSEISGSDGVPVFPGGVTPVIPEVPFDPEAEPMVLPLSSAADLCNEIVDMYNVSQSNCSIAPGSYAASIASGDFSGAEPQIVLNNGLRLFIASDFINIPRLVSEDESVLIRDKQGYILYIDSNGGANGKSRVNTDVFVFYLLKSGKMVPDGGFNNVNRLGGADSTENLTVNVLYDDLNNDDRVVKVLARSVDYRTAACMSGTVISHLYCTRPNGSFVVKNAICTPESDCRIQVNRPMRRLFW